MDMTLTRKDSLPTGIFGELVSGDESLKLFTLEREYRVGDENPPIYQPKVPPGVYTCQRGQHQLVDMIQPFETFEVMNVPGHTNILFHTGNVADDSSGCILVGLFRSGNDSIMQSRAAFTKLMDLQNGVSEFILTVT